MWCEDIASTFPTMASPEPPRCSGGSVGRGRDEGSSSVRMAGMCLGPATGARSTATARATARPSAPSSVTVVNPSCRNYRFHQRDRLRHRAGHVALLRRGPAGVRRRHRSGRCRGDCRRRRGGPAPHRIRGNSIEPRTVRTAPTALFLDESPNVSQRPASSSPNRTRPAASASEPHRQLRASPCRAAARARM